MDLEKELVRLLDFAATLPDIPRPVAATRARPADVFMTACRQDRDPGPSVLRTVKGRPGGELKLSE